MGNVFLADAVIDIFHADAGIFLMPRKVIIGAIRNGPKLILSERKFIFHINRPFGIEGALGIRNFMIEKFFLFNPIMSIK